VLVFVIFHPPHQFRYVLRNVLDNAGLENLTFYWFYYWPIVVLSLVAFESFWLGQTELEMRALAIDWLFVLAYLGIWGFEIVRMRSPIV
jgi:hypothetical protein